MTTDPIMTPNPIPTTRAEVDAWVTKVADALPDGPFRAHWLAYPPGDTLHDELEARLLILDAVVAYLAGGGQIEVWEDVFR